MARDVPADQVAFINQLRPSSDEDLRLVAKQIEGLQAHPGWAALNTLIDETHGNAVNRLIFENAGVDAKSRPYEDLTRLLGFMAGLRQYRVAALAVTTAHARRERQNDEGAT